jgi:hypothetical protein
LKQENQGYKGASSSGASTAATSNHNPASSKS